MLDHIIGSTLLLVQQELVRDSLKLWLERCCDHVEPNAMAEVDSAHIDSVAIVLIFVADPLDADGWFARQIDWLRDHSPNLAVAILADASAATEALIRRSGVPSHIPTCMKSAVAKAALGLIMAGGVYMTFAGPTAKAAAPAEDAPSGLNLTRREHDVLIAMTTGAQNKIIAHRLNMSLSTVKAHVHSIITKFRVNNRTEAVMTAQSMMAAAGN